MKQPPPTPSKHTGRATAVHYYLDDKLGTAQVELSAGGWPLWQGQFTPFGAELQDGRVAHPKTGAPLMRAFCAWVGGMYVEDDPILGPSNPGQEM